MNQPTLKTKSFRALHRARLALGRRLLAESGQSLIIMTIAVTVTIGMGALSIDVASWYRTHHQAQVAADAASLAAANCLANAGGSSTNDVCTSTADTTHAAQVATSIAADNGLTIPTSDVSFNDGVVTVKLPTSAPGFFANFVGIHSASVQADSAASYLGPHDTVSTSYNTISTTITNVSTVPTTTTDSGSPLVLFGMDSGCSDTGVDQQGGSMTIDGGILSNSGVSLDPGGSSYETVEDGPGCSVSEEGGGGTFNPSTNNPSSETVTVPDQAADWPVPYDTSADPLPACTDTYSGSGTWDIGNPPGGAEVYCYPGGAIELTGYENYDDDTFICGSFSIQGGGISLEAANYPTNKLLIYATGTGTPVSLTNGSGTVIGDVETPNGNITLDSGSNNFTGLLEGLSVSFSGGSDTITGDGPTTYYTQTTYSTTTTTTPTTSTTSTTSTSTVPGNDSLVQ